MAGKLSTRLRTRAPSSRKRNPISRKKILGRVQKNDMYAGPALDLLAVRKARRAMQKKRTPATEKAFLTAVNKAKGRKKGKV